MDSTQAIRARIGEMNRLLRDVEGLLRSISEDLDLSVFELFISHNEFELAWHELNAATRQGNATPDVYHALSLAAQYIGFSGSYETSFETDEFKNLSQSRNEEENK